MRDAVMQRRNFLRLAVAVLCLSFAFILGRKSKYGSRDYLKKFKIEKVEYTESLIYESHDGLQNDGLTLAIYYDVDITKAIRYIDSWERMSDFPTASSILKNVSLYSGLDFQIPKVTNGNFLLYDNKQHKELHSEVELETLLSHSTDMDFSFVTWDAEKNIIYIVEYRT